MAAAMFGCRGECAAGIRYRIKPARMPWMTFAQAARGQAAAFNGAMQADSFGSVIRTAWIKAAVLSKKRTDAEFVGAQQ